jgi:hypothetical protein
MTLFWKTVIALILAVGFLVLFIWLLVNHYLPPTHFIIGLLLIAVVLTVLLAGRQVGELLGLSKTGAKSSTPRSLAFFLLGTYTFALLLAGIGAMA